MIIKFFGANEFLPQNKILQFLAKYGCELTEAERYICENTVFVLCGFDKAQYNEVCEFYLIQFIQMSLLRPTHFTDVNACYIWTHACWNFYENRGTLRTGDS